MCWYRVMWRCRTRDRPCTYATWQGKLWRHVVDVSRSVHGCRPIESSVIIGRCPAARAVAVDSYIMDPPRRRRLIGLLRHRDVGGSHGQDTTVLGRTDWRISVYKSGGRRRQRNSDVVMTVKPPASRTGACSLLAHKPAPISYYKVIIRSACALFMKDATVFRPSDCWSVSHTQPGVYTACIHIAYVSKVRKVIGVQETPEMQKITRRPIMYMYTVFRKNTHLHFQL